MIVVLSGPSGVGKTTIAKLLEQEGFARSISFTTREMRPGEIEGEDYNFISKSDFEKKISEHFFLESVFNFHNYYGSSSKLVEEYLNQGKNVVMCLTLEGFLAAKKKWKERVLGIFLMPPDASVLRDRISARDTNDLEIRMRAIYDSSNLESKSFDFKVEPDTLENVFKKISDIIKKTYS